MLNSGNWVFLAGVVQTGLALRKTDRKFQALIAKDVGLELNRAPGTHGHSM